MEFYGDLAIYIVIIAFWVFVAWLMYEAVRLVWYICDRLSERRREKKELRRRKAVYRKRQEEYRRECFGCYPRE